MKVAVIGAGHQGLVAAVILARAGCEVVVWEQGSQAGGCLWTDTTADGVVVERGAFEHGGILEVAAELGLENYGLTYRDHRLLSGTAFTGGEQRIFDVDLATTLDGLGADRDAYRRLAELAGALFGLLDGFPTPPTLTEAAAAMSGLRGGDNLFRTLLQPAEIVLQAAIEDPYTRAALEVYAAHGQIPPSAPGSGMFALLLPSMHGGRAARPVGGSAQLTAALVAALEQAGGRLELDAAVEQLLPGPDGAEIVTPHGRQHFDQVVSTIDVRRVAQLIPDLDPELLGSVASLHSGHFNVSELTVSLVYDQPAPQLPGPDQDVVWFTADRPGVFRPGFAQVMAGQLPKSPWSMLGRPAQPDPAGAGSLWLSSVVPLRRDGESWTKQAEAEAAQRVVEAVSTVLDTDLSSHEVERYVSGPLVWANRLGSDGNPNHLDLSIDQLLGWRPAPLPLWRQRFSWLWWAGAGSHPGGGLSGASGRSAANGVLGRSAKRSAVGEIAGLWRAFQAYLAMRRG